MATRTLKFQGWGTGTATINAFLNGQPVFSGDVDLEPMTDDNSHEKTAPTLFSIEIPIEMAGTYPMKITVGKSAVRFGLIIANYTEVNWGKSYYTGPYEFADVAPVDNFGSRDPRVAVKIDGIAQPQPDRSVMKGTWHYSVNPGSTMEHDLRISQGSELEF